MTARLLALLALSGVVTACSNAEPGYPLDVNQVYARLEASKLEALIRTRRCGVPVSVQVYRPSEREVEWSIRSGGEEYLSLTATLQPTSNGRTLVTLAAKDSVYGDQAYSGDKPYPRPLLSQPILPAFQAQVDALIAGTEMADPGNRDQVCGVQAGSRESKVVNFQADDYYWSKRDERWIKRPGREER